MGNEYILLSLFLGYRLTRYVLITDIGLIPQTGCLGCASGKGQPRNIFGNKYGQSLAAVQIARERRRLEKQQQEQQRQQQKHERQRLRQEREDDDEETGDETGDDYGPSPTAGIWAGSQRLQNESYKLDNGDDDGEAETDDEGDSDDVGPRPAKKLRDE
jgi:bud site selection protein 31